MDQTTGRLDDFALDGHRIADDRLPFGDDIETTRRTSAIREEIEQTREEMANTIDAIQDRLRPRRIAAEATKRIKAATTEGARAMADTAGELAQNAINRTRETARDVLNRTRDTSEVVANRTRRAADGLVDRIRENPVPAALIGVGLACWAFTRLRSRRHDETETETSWDAIRGESNHHYFGDNEYDNTREFDGGFESGNGFDRATGDTPGLLSSAKEYASGTTRAISGTTRAIGRTSRRASSQIGRVARENPLLLGAGALLVGAAVGMAMPGTETERQWMGETRDAFLARAKQAASDAAKTVRTTATEVADAASQLAESVTGKRV